MKKQLSVALLLVSAMALQTAALADDEWFHRYDHDKDGHWTYTEFKKLTLTGGSITAKRRECQTQSCTPSSTLLMLNITAG